MPTTVLYATDFSEASGPAFDEARKLSKLTGSRLVVAHVLHFPPMLFDLPAQTDETEDAMRRWCQHRLEELAAKAGAAGVKAETELREDPHAHEGIVKLAREKDALMIVLGTHGRTGLSKLVLGSVAARVIAVAPCPVLTVRGA